MPIQVDHDEQRRKVIEVAASLIASGGAEAATVRAIAKAAGYSTTIVSHYFTDKRALLLMTYQYAADHVREIVRGIRNDDPSFVRSFCASLLPRTSELQTIWRTWFAFWNMALVDAAFAAEQRRHVADARRRLCDGLAHEPHFAGLPLHRREEEARDLLTLIMGIALQAILDPADWPADRQLKLVDDRLEAGGHSLPRDRPRKVRTFRRSSRLRSRVQS